MNLLARVEQGLTDVLGGDIGYGGRITKNPTQTAHMPLWGASEALYGLSKTLLRLLWGRRSPPSASQERPDGLRLHGGQECRPLQPHPPVGLQGAFTLHGLHGVVRDGVRLCFDEECFGDC